MAQMCSRVSGLSMSEVRSTLVATMDTSYTTVRECSWWPHETLAFPTDTCSI